MGSCRELTVETFCEVVLPVFSVFLGRASDADVTSTVCVAELVNGLSSELGSWTWRSCCGSGAGLVVAGWEWELGNEGGNG